MNLKRFATIILVASLIALGGGFAYYLQQKKIFKEDYYDLTVERLGYDYTPSDLRATQAVASRKMGEAKTTMLAGGIVAFVCIAALASITNGPTTEKHQHDKNYPQT